MSLENQLQSGPLDFTSLAQLRASSKAKNENAIKEVSQQFEAIFLNMMLKAMRKATEKSGLTDSHATEAYEQMFDQEIASRLSKTGSLGIAEAIERQIMFQQGSDAVGDKDNHDGDKVVGFLPIHTDLKLRGFHNKKSSAEIYLRAERV